MYKRVGSIALVVIYSLLTVTALSLLLVSRTSVGPYVDSNMHPWFWTTYLIMIAFLVTIIMSKKESLLKFSFIVVFSVTSCLFVVILFPGFGWDTWAQLGFCRRVYENVFYDAYGWPWPFSFYASRNFLSNVFHSFESGPMYSLPVIFARIFCVDVYWTHLLLIPLLWGVFIPVISYSIAKALCKARAQRAALLSGILVTSVTSLISWGKFSVPNSLGYIFFFLTLYLLLRYLSRNEGMLLAIVTAFMSFISHYVTGIVCFSLILLAFSFKEHRILKRRRIAGVQLIIAFIFCTSLLPVSHTFRGYFGPSYVYFTLSKLSQLSAYDAVLSLVFTQYGKFTIGDFVTSGGLVDLFGFLALLVYGVFKPKKVDKGLCQFLLLAFFLLTIDFRILVWFMTQVTKRIGPCISLIAIPLTAIFLDDLISFLSPAKQRQSPLEASSRKTVLRSYKFNLRDAIAMVIIILSITGMISSSIHNAYNVTIVGFTEYDLQAAKYIDETTPEKYVVICDKRFAVAGYAVVGVRNPRAFYPYLYDYPDVLGWFGEMVSDPSPEIMIEAAKINNAAFQYFVVGTRSTLGAGVTLSEVVEKASRHFDLYGLFGNGKDHFVYVFRYEAPPLPSTSDVSAFYWDSPPSYIIQNDLMRIVVPGNESLEVRDFEGELYEGIDFGKTFVDDTPLGNPSKVEYFDPYREIWTKWDFSGEVSLTFAMKQQFRFRLLFEKVALVAVVERGKPFVQLHWETLDDISHNVRCYLMTGTYEQFLIPGLTDAENPGSVYSRRYGGYYTVSLTEDVSLHYAGRYGIPESALYPYHFKDLSNFQWILWYYFSYDLYVDNDADSGRWVYIETYPAANVSGGSVPPFQYSTDGGETWTNVYGGPLKTLNGTEVNWVVTGARQFGGAWEKPKKWHDFLGGMGGTYILPDNFTDSGGCLNRIIFGMYLPGDTNPGSETYSGENEGDQALIRIGAAYYSLGATYVFEDAEHASYGLHNMNDIFLTFSAAGELVGGVTFTKKLTSLNITATKEDTIDHITFNVQTDATFSLFAEFTESAAYESLTRLSYNVSEIDNEVSLVAKANYANDWDRLGIVTICVPSNYDREGGEPLYIRGASVVLKVDVTDGDTETITIWPT